MQWVFKPGCGDNLDRRVSILNDHFLWVLSLKNLHKGLGAVLFLQP